MQSIDILFTDHVIKVMTSVNKRRAGNIVSTMVTELLVHWSKSMCSPGNTRFLGFFYWSFYGKRHFETFLSFIKFTNLSFIKSKPRICVLQCSYMIPIVYLRSSLKCKHLVLYLDNYMYV